MSYRPLHSLLIALFVWASLPAWTVQARHGHGRSLACVHACALLDSVLTQGGKLASLGQGDCSVSAVDRADAVLVGAVKVGSPPMAAALAACAPIASPAPGLAYQAAAPRRGPPALGGFLSCEHRQAQAPPQS